MRLAIVLGARQAISRRGREYSWCSSSSTCHVSSLGVGERNCTCQLLFLVKSLKDPCSSSTCLEISYKCLSLVLQAFLRLLYLCCITVRLFVCCSFKVGPQFLLAVLAQPADFKVPGVEPHTKPDVTGIHLPGAGVRICCFPSLCLQWPSLLGSHFYFVSQLDPQAYLHPSFCLPFGHFSTFSHGEYVLSVFVSFSGLFVLMGVWS